MRFLCYCATSTVKRNVRFVRPSPKTFDMYAICQEMSVSVLRASVLNDKGFIQRIFKTYEEFSQVLVCFNAPLMTIIILDVIEAVLPQHLQVTVFKSMFSLFSHTKIVLFIAIQVYGSGISSVIEHVLKVCNSLKCLFFLLL